MKMVGRKTVVNEILSSGGRFFSILFKKRTKDQSLRLMNCRVNYSNLKENLEKKLIPVIENVGGAKQYRNIAIEGIVLASVNKKNLRVKGS